MTDTFAELAKATKGEHTSAVRKQTLLDMATKGEERPLDSSSLGRCLRQYTYPKSGSYDPNFTQQIQNLRPDWMKRKYDSSSKKEKIIDLATKNMPKKSVTVAGLDSALRSYTSKKSPTYDENFYNLLKKIAPKWFLSSFDYKKESLIEMAISGYPRPDSKTALGKVLESIMNIRSTRYDPAAIIIIQENAPHWFA